VANIYPFFFNCLLKSSNDKSRRYGEESMRFCSRSVTDSLQTFKLISVLAAVKFGISTRRASSIRPARQHPSDYYNTAIADRLVENSQILKLKGGSLRKA
jgi:hypothetical protein